MKQLLFLLLFPSLALAQYPGNGNQKITLGEQTTADGLVFRGVAADTTRKPSVDTMAFILLDTNTNIIWQYKKAVNNAWTRVGGSISSGVTGVLPVANGGTNTSTLTANKVMVGNGTSGVLTPTNLHWDNTNSRLGIGVANPLSAIHTNGVFTTGSTNVGYVNLKGFLWGTTGLEADYRWQSDALSNANNDLNFYSRSYGDAFRLNYSTGAMRIFNLSGTGIRPLSAAADGTLTVSSSITIKENVSNLNYGLDKIMQLQPKSFNYIDKNKYGEGLDIGFIAEDVYSIVPEATGTMNDGFIYFDAVRLIPILTKAIQEQQALIKALEQRIINLENK